MKKMFIVLTFLVLITTSGCSKKETYKLGFAGTLSGQYASVGTSEMYATEMAVEEINAAGGINGRQIELFIKDDEASADKAVEVDNELKELGIDVIIGHSLSKVTQKALDNANENDLLFLSPSIGSEAFSNIKDNLFRNVATTFTEGKSMTEYIIEDDPEKVLFVYNTDNIILTEYHKASFEETMTENGYTSDDYDIISFASNNTEDLASIELALSSENYDTLFFVSSNNDAAPIVNYVIANDLDIDIHLTSWASIGLLPIIDTVNTDGIYLYLEYLEDLESQKFVDFKTKFESTYGQKVDMLSVNAYDMVYLLKTVVEDIDSFDIELIKEGIISIKDFNGVIDTFSINEYGDCVRRNYQLIIVDGELVETE